jgi:hypothetical protein
VELLANFVCAANAKNVDTGNVVVFATDVEARTATEKLGLHVFYDEEGGFGDLPTDEAKAYGDATFTAMMYIKVLAVYLPMMLGYEVLFQDVDVVWHENPLPYFADKSRCGDFDTYFSDDGARSMRYAPFSANSGFYFLRNNDKTTCVARARASARERSERTRAKRGHASEARARERSEGTRA